jgi:hypothetical protein
MKHQHEHYIHKGEDDGKKHSTSDNKVFGGDLQIK